MSLPREWRRQDSRGSLHRSGGPTGAFATTSAQQIAAAAAAAAAADAITASTPTTTTNIVQTTPPPLRFAENECPISVADCAVVAHVGSLSSIHSAPPVPLADLNAGGASLLLCAASAAVVSTSAATVVNGGGSVTAAAPSTAGPMLGGGRGLVNFQLGPPDSPDLCARPGAAGCRPVSLALSDAQAFHSNRTIAAMPMLHYGQQQQQQPHNQAASEADEEDNENLLTVSSLTARPLIAKSHELRTTKLTERFRGRNRRHLGGVPHEPPDGGYGWLVVMGAFFVQFWVAGLVKSYGVLFVEILETFPNSSTAVASWIPAILSALCLALAPLSSALCQRFSCRTVVFVGGLFCTFGLTLSYFATSMYHLLFTFGILTGIGGGLSTTPGIIIVSLYFDKHRALANGICVSGTAAGSFVFPMLIEHLCAHFGFHGTILILGGCMLHVCASAMLYRPIECSDEHGGGGAGGGDEVSASNSVGRCGGQQHRSPQLRAVVSSAAGLDTSTTFVGGSAAGGGGGNGDVSAVSNKRYIEHLFLEESKNRMNDFYNKNKFVKVSEKSITAGVDSDDEVKDIVGETRFMKPIKSIRSSSLLHSVEDLSTDSTCVYRARSGFDSNRSSRRRAAVAKPTTATAAAAAAPFVNVGSTDEMLGTVSGGVAAAAAASSAMQQSAKRGLSKSMIIPTPVSDFSEYDEDDEENAADGQKRKSRSCCEWIKQYLDITLLKDAKFIAMSLSVTLMSTGCPYMLYFLPAYTISAGHTKSEAGYLVAISAALDLFGRLGFGYLSDLQLFDRKKAYTVCILGAGAAVLMLPSAASSFYLLGLSVATYGLCLGSWFLLVPVLLADMFGTERISSSYGLVRMFQSLGAISVPPLAGFMRDLTGGYEVCFYCMGTCMMLGSVPLLLSTTLCGDGDEEEDDEEEGEEDEEAQCGGGAMEEGGNLSAICVNVADADRRTAVS